MKISQLIEKLSVIHEEEGDCEVFASLAPHASQFAIGEAVFASRNDARWPVPPHQNWLPARAVLTLQVA